MESITRKGEIKAITDECIKTYKSEGLSGCMDKIKNDLLASKIKFPLLEFAAEELFKEINQDDVIKGCHIIDQWKTIGGNVLIGIFLRNLLYEDYEKAIKETVSITSKADIWYTCDIIGERIYGTALLQFPDLALADYEKLANHQSPWVIRALGAGAHHAIKKGLPKAETEKLFRFLLNLANHKHKEVRQGIGWAAKTTAKFYPEIIEQHKDSIQDPKLTAGWFRRKVEIGLARNRHAQRSRG